MELEALHFMNILLRNLSVSQGALSEITKKYKIIFPVLFILIYGNHENAWVAVKVFVLARWPKKSPTIILHTFLKFISEVSYAITFNLTCFQL